MKFESTGLQDAFPPGASSDRPANAQEGFTLLETLVGLTILAVALTALFGAYSDGTRASLTSNRFAGAQVMAQSLLAHATAHRNLPAARSSGTSGDYRWRIVARPMEQVIGATPNDNLWRLYHIKVTVGWDRSRKFELSTLHLMRGRP